MILCRFYWTFFLWFLDKINGKDTLLMGLTLVIQCFFGELPFFALADRIMKYLGHSNSLSLVMISFAVRYLCYGYLITKETAYYVLLVELLQGPSIGLFYAVMADIAQSYALKGSLLVSQGSTPDVHDKTFATMQGILSACFEGLGLGLGSLLAGYLFDAFSLRVAWTLSAIIAFLGVFVNMIGRIVINYIDKRNGDVASQ